MMLTLCISLLILNSHHQPWAVVLPSHMNWIVRVKDSFPSRKVLRKLLRETYSSALAKWSNSFFCLFCMPGSKVPDIAQLRKTAPPPTNQKKTPVPIIRSPFPNRNSGESSQSSQSSCLAMDLCPNLPAPKAEPNWRHSANPLVASPGPFAHAWLGCGPPPTLHDILHMGPSGAKAGANWGSLIIIQTSRYGWKLYNIHQLYSSLYSSFIHIHTLTVSLKITTLNQIGPPHQ
jgi:hypothetical protein